MSKKLFPISGLVISSVALMFVALGIIIPPVAGQSSSPKPSFSPLTGDDIVIMRRRLDYLESDNRRLKDELDKFNKSEETATYQTLAQRIGTSSVEISIGAIIGAAITLAGTLYSRHASSKEVKQEKTEGDLKEVRDELTKCYQKCDELMQRLIKNPEDERVISLRSEVRASIFNLGTFTTEDFNTTNLVEMLRNYSLNDPAGCSELLDRLTAASTDLRRRIATKKHL